LNNKEINETKKVHKILIVDDEVEVLDALTITLKMANQFKSDISIAEDGEEALTELEKHDFDLILSDYMIPKIDGINLLKRAKEKNPNIIRILITGKLDYQVAREAIKNADVDHLIEKPWSDDELRYLIHGALKKKIEDESKRSNLPIDNVKSALRIIRAIQEKPFYHMSSGVKRSVSFEFIQTEEFNNFFSKIKKMRNVRIDDIHISENKYFIKLGVYLRSYERI